MSKNKIGGWFEKKVREACEENRAKNGFFYHRLQDTKAAGNYLPSQPADFLVGYPWHACLLECKASESHYSLKECVSDMVDPDQAAYHKWWNGLFLPSYFLFYSEPIGYVESWTGLDVARARQEKKKLTSPVHCCDIGSLSENLLLLLGKE